MKHSFPSCFFLLFGIILGSEASVQAQIPHPDLPVISVPQEVVIPRYVDQQERIKQQNAALMQEVEQYNQQQQSRKQQAQAIIQEALNDFHQSPLAAEDKRLSAPKRYTLPSFEHQARTTFYRQAAQQLQQMLEGNQPLRLKKAVFLVENAYADNTLSYPVFEAAIQQMVKACRAKLLADGFTMDNQLAKLRAIHQYMADTLAVKIPGQGKKISYPFQYDFEDIYGEQDWRKQFVTKLIHTRSGQCHSLPLLYLILAQEMGTQAYWAFAPSHSYVKFQDDKNQWYNLELTHGKISSNAWLVASGYIKAEAIRNKIYLQPMDLRQTVAYALVDLAHGYQKRFGWDAFTLKCLEQNLRYHPANIGALQMNSDYYYKLSEHVVRQFRSRAELESDAQASAILQKGQQAYQLVATMGFADMPKEVYQAWLQSFEEEKNRQHQAKPKQ